MSNYAFAHEGKAYTPEGVIEVSNVEAHNKALEAREIEWLKTGPDKVFLYVSLPGRTTDVFAQPLTGARINTWLGTSVATNVVIGSKSYTGFGYSYRRSVSCRIFGVLYHGWYYESSGDYCRLKKAKRQ